MPSSPQRAAARRERPRKTLIRLTRENDGVPIAVQCSTCSRVYGLNDSFAERCCDPRCADCGAELPVGSCWVACDPCRAKRDAARQADLRAKAKRVPESEYDGPVYFDGAWNEGYLRDVDELRDWADCEGVELPDAVWACTATRLQLKSAESLCEDLTADSFDDAFDMLVGIEELQKAVDVFNAAQTAEEWDIDHTRLVVLEVPNV